MLLTLFFLFRDGDRFYEHVYRAIPLEEGHKARLLDRLSTTISAVVRGTLLVALAQGMVAGIAYALLGVPFPVFWGALSALMALMPFGGTALIWGPAALYLFWTAPIWKGVVMLAVGGGLVGLMDNLLYPMIVGSEAKLPVLLLFLASLGGLGSFGLIGLFLGPILLAIVLTAFRIYQEDYQAGPAPPEAGTEEPHS